MYCLVVLCSFGSRKESGRSGRLVAAGHGGRGPCKARQRASQEDTNIDNRVSVSVCKSMYVHVFERLIRDKWIYLLDRDANRYLYRSSMIKVILVE